MSISTETRMNSWLLKCLTVVVVSLFLTACNSGEDFSDAFVGGGLINPVPGDTSIPGTEDPALEVELVVAVNDGGVVRTAQISGLGYRCGSATGRILSTGTKPFLARCGTSASKVEFFIGPDSGAWRLVVGEAVLPLCTGRSEGTDGQSCLGGEGYFQVALSDIIAAPEPSIDMPLSAPARRAAEDPDVYNRAALLAALDANSDPLHVRIPFAALEDVTEPPAANFSQAAYATFRNYWQQWLDEVDLAVDPGASALRGLPATDADAIALARAAMNRTRVGLFQMNCGYGDVVSCADTIGSGPRLFVEVPLIVMPDGSAGGMGILFSAPEGGSENVKSDLLAIQSGSLFTESLRVNSINQDAHWEANSVLDSAYANLFFEGRMIGSVVYSNLENVDGKTDYQLEYPSATYPLKEDDVGRFSGTVDGNVFSEGLTYRIGRTAFVSSVLHPGVLSVLPDFYRITIFKACTEPHGECQTIPENEIGEGRNYPLKIVAAEDNEITVEEERPRGGAPGDAFLSGSFNLQFLPDGSVITDRRGQCRALADPADLLRHDGLGGTDQEYRVGYVSRTFPDAGNESANLVLFMTGSASKGGSTVTGQTVPPMPQYGTRIEGRLKLSDDKKSLLRLSDSNFADGIRAFWQDLYQPYRLSNPLNDAPLEGQDALKFRALQSGAASGIALDDCQPVEPSPP